MRGRMEAGDTRRSKARYPQVIRRGLRSKCLILRQHDDGPALPDRAEHVDQKVKHRLRQLQLPSTRADQRGTALSEDLRQQAIHLLEVLRSEFARNERVIASPALNGTSARGCGVPPQAVAGASRSGN